jgi:hypothetical protein
MTSLAIHAGGAECSPLDLSTEKDRGMVRNAMRHWPKRWRGLNKAKKQEFVDSLTEANETARRQLQAETPAAALAAASAVASIVRTAVMMEGHNQTDYWNADKNARLDAGKATERVGGVVMEVVGPRHANSSNAVRAIPDPAVDTPRQLPAAPDANGDDDGEPK